MSTAMKVKVVEYFSHEVWVVSREFKGSISDFGKQVLHSLLDERSLFVFGDLPGLLHHADEVLVAWGAHGKLCVVFLPLFPGNRAVVVASAAIELVEEVGENLLFTLAALNELGVAGHVVDTCDLCYIDSSGTVLVKSRESFLNHSQSSLRKRLLQSANKFLVSNTSVSVNVIVSHQSLQLNLLWEQSESTESLLKLTGVELLVSIEVHSLEDSSEGSETDSSLLLNGKLELQIELTNHNI